MAVLLLLVRAGEARPSWILSTAGIILTGAGELIRLWAVRHIGAISRTRSDRLGPLVASGPFALSRNPLYVGNILIWSGLALTAQLLWLAPLIALALLAEYNAIVRWEEEMLNARHGAAYRSYTGSVPRWIPTPRGATSGPRAAEPCTDPAASFSWKETIFSERGTLLALTAGYILLWLKLYSERP